MLAFDFPSTQYDEVSEVCFATKRNLPLGTTLAEIEKSVELPKIKIGIRRVEVRNDEGLG